MEGVEARLEMPLTSIFRSQAGQLGPALCHPTSPLGHRPMQCLGPHSTDNGLPERQWTENGDHIHTEGTKERACHASSARRKGHGNEDLKPRSPPGTAGPCPTPPISVSRSQPHHPPALQHGGSAVICPASTIQGSQLQQQGQQGKELCPIFWHETGDFWPTLETEAGNRHQFQASPGSSVSSRHSESLTPTSRKEPWVKIPL